MINTTNPINQTTRGVAIAVFGLLFAVYLFTYTGYIQSSDGLAMFATVENMVRRGAIDSNQLLWMGIQQGSFGPDGTLYSRKGIGMGLLAYPFAWIALHWPNLGLVHAALLLNPLLTAWTGALLYRTGRRLGWTVSTAAATALLFGLGTLAWPYTQTFFSDPVCGWGLFGAFYGLLSFRQSGRKRYLMGSGLAWSLAYLARTVNLVTLPVFVAALLVALYRRQRGAAAPALQLSFVTQFGRDHWRPLISFLIPVVIGGIVSLWWNWIRFGSIWESGYVESEAFSAPWLFGIVGLVAGPARGFFWYSPILLLGFGGFGWFWQRLRWFTGSIIALCAIYLLLYGKWYMWHGGYSWGPRFLVPLVPFLAILIGPAWERLMVERRWGNGGRLFTVVLLALSIAVQLVGLAVPFALVQDWLATTVEPLFAPETFTNLTYSPLLRQWDFLQSDQIHLAWWRATLRQGQIDWQGLILPLVGIVLSLLTLVTYARQSQERRTRRLYGLLYVAILSTIAVALLLNYQITLGSPALQPAADRIAHMERPGDVILYLRPTETQQFANLYHGRLPTLGLIPRENLLDEDQQWLQQLRTNYARVWVVSDDGAPERSGWEQPMRAENFLIQENRLPGTDNSRLALYAMASPETLTEAGSGILFGDPNNDAAITAGNGWIRLTGYAISKEVTPGGLLLIELRWESLQSVAENYHVFVHLLDQHGDKIDQRDGQPVQWMRPISSWQPGEEIIDHYGMLLPVDTFAGVYHVVVGLYDPVSGQRLPVSAGPGDYTVELGPIDVRRN
ncbi:MAG: hypothetical protein KDE58_10140 [Caldilineaceae bacterium]|nr:hypothetical protein [Caldilineaceae bacterium]